jgi:hypothetical protein
MSGKMNKRPQPYTNPRIAALEKELQGDNYVRQSTFSVDAGRDVQTDLTSGQRRALGATRGFLLTQGHRRRHPLNTLSSYAGLVKTNQDPKEHYAQYMNEMHQRVQLPDIVKKARNEFSPNQVGLVQTATENFAKSKQKLSSMIPISM